jgi:acyl-CoA thioester hydrolase
MKEDNTLAAILNVDGAWIDLNKRKLAVPGEFIRHIFENFPKGQDFQMASPTTKR